MRTFCIKFERQLDKCCVPVKFGKKIVGRAYVHGNIADVTVNDDTMKSIINKCNRIAVTSMSMEVLK